jgi:hypothetical protein
MEDGYGGASRISKRAISFLSGIRVFKFKIEAEVGK